MGTGIWGVGYGDWNMGEWDMGTGIWGLGYGDWDMGTVIWGL